MEPSARIVITLVACLIASVALRVAFGPAPIAGAAYASAKLGAVADPFAAPIEMAVSDSARRIAD